ncbi:hypothetical protein HDV00_012183 [Rhizophlyctis rosea]|nr:hypothetical protein HDV00_012183 [Rhizophlyctis rosea]
MFFLVSQKTRARRVIAVFAVLATFATFLFLLGTSVTTAGLKQTCNELETPNPSLKCSTIWDNGFFVNEQNNTYSKDLKTFVVLGGLRRGGVEELENVK